MHELTKEEIEENKRTGKVPEVDEKRMPTKDLLEEPTEEIKQDENKLIEFINRNRRKDSSMVRVGKSTIPNAGLGLFADRDITEGERIRGATYGGRIMNFNEAKKIPMEEKDYVMALHLNVHVDAKEHYGYMARYINDTYKTEKSRNCKFLKMRVENKRRRQISHERYRERRGVVHGIREPGIGERGTRKLMRTEVTWRILRGTWKKRKNGSNRKGSIRVSKKALEGI